VFKKLKKILDATTAQQQRDKYAYKILIFHDARDR